jgi:hypothetical protein
MERFFQILAVILAGVAAYFLWQGSADRAFISAVFGAVSFFLSVRVQVKGRLREREAARVEEEKRRAEEISDSEMPELNEMPAGEQISNGQRTTDKEQL